jgi:uncharacterized pyridoxamine 5'-phosphate oxidase family protein
MTLSGFRELDTPWKIWYCELTMRRELDSEVLERLIIELLRSAPVCVIATCSHDIPRASTVEFFPLGTTLYIVTEGGTKVQNILNNPHVSVAIHASFTGWESVKGLQITGTAELGKKGSRVFKEGLEAYRNRKGLKRAELPDFMDVVKVTPSSMEYIDFSLEEKGFNVRQLLKKDNTFHSL